MPLNLATLAQRLEPNCPWQRRLVVEPLLDLEGLESGEASLDFHLGNRFAVLRRRRATQHNPLSLEDVAPSELFVPMGEELFLHPGQIVLGTTLEWFRFPGDLMAYVIGRSIWGRRGLLIVTASAVQPGSCGTITLELSNMGEVAVVLKPGVAIGQLFFHETKARGRRVRRSTFMGSLRPTLGEYRISPVEQLYLNHGRSDGGEVRVAAVPEVGSKNQPILEAFQGEKFHR